ncbi:MAG: hypothetical protein M1608_17535 [Candidatus Omnitrophica bacterium]|nr:hypothetical protein [Candidatus Omnitrophota bacterium]
MKNTDVNSTMMNRRVFLQASAAGVAAASVAGIRLFAEGQTDDWVSRSLDGKTYEATVPDTLELADRARLALNGLGGNIDPELMTMYGQIFFCARRPYLSHWGSAETLCDPKFAESFPLMRLMSGSDQYADLERSFRKSILSRVDDGLYWDRVNPRRPWRNSYSAWLYGKGRDEDFSTLVGTGRLLRALLVWRELDGDKDYDRMLDELCGGLRRVLVVEDNYGYYPVNGGWAESCAYPRSGWLNKDEAKIETDGGEGSVVGMHGHQLYGAAHWYEQSGSKVALELATKLANYCMLPRFWGGVADPNGDRKGLPGHIAPQQPDPLFTAGSELGHWYTHFHCRAIALRGLLAYGGATDNARAIEFVRRAYEFTLTQGIARMGWVNCYPGAMNLMEGCALGDLVGLAVRLSDLGAGDYWDDVDAVVRNHLVEQQFTRADLLETVVERFKDAPDTTSKKAPGEVCFDNVIKRSIGSFAGLSLANMIPNPIGLQCCTGNATQGLYYAWEGTLRETVDRAVVNLFLNRAGRLVDVESCLPYEGKVVLRNKQARSIAVRIPSWVDKRELGFGSVKLSTEPYWIGRYLMFDGPQAGAAITLTFPVRTQKSTYTINEGAPQQMQYSCEFRGSTVIEIKPQDEAPSGIPLYQRSKMRASTTPFHKVRRFVAEKTVRGW